MFRFFLIIFLFFFSTYSDKIDGVAAIVDDEIILFSELNAYTTMRLSGLGISADSIDMSEYKHTFLNELIDGKVLLVHGIKDTTISVSDDEVDQATSNHIGMLLKQNNISIDSFEIELRRQQGISLSKFKSDAKKIIKEQLLKQKVQQTYLSSIKVTKKDVENFYNEYKDSLPKMGKSVLLSKLSLKISPSEKIRQIAFEKITSIKSRLDNGADFSDMAKSFSEGPESIQGGDLGFISKGTLNELTFEEMAFNLSPGQISDPFETRLGFHIINCLERRNQKVHIRQIFIKVEPSQESINNIYSILDSIRLSCKSKKDFINAVKKFSEDPVSKSQNGLMRWTSLIELPSEIVYAIDSLPVGSISLPVKSADFMSIYRLDDRLSERTLTIDNDYSLLEKKTEDILSQKKLIDLVSQWRKNIFISVKL